MACLHPSGTITDYAVQSLDHVAVRYAWRGACTSCSHGVVGATTVPVELGERELTSRLTQELMAYLSYAAPNVSVRI